jgi:hypothetical protein
MASLKEITAPVLAKVKYRQKEREIHFSNSWDRPGIYFYIVKIRTILLTRKKVSINLRPNRHDGDHVFLERMQDSLDFAGKKAMTALIIAILQNEPDDENLQSQLDLDIFALFYEIYDTNPHERENLLGAVTRFHAITYDIPKLHEIFAENVEL